MNSLVFALEDYSRLRNSLLAHAPNEAAAILLAGHSSANGTTKLFIREVAQVPDDAYLVQHTDQLEIQPVFIARHLKKARDEDLSLVLAHSHPFKGRVAFSRADDRGEGILMPTLFQRAPSRPHGALVIGPEGFCSRVRLSVEQVQAISALYEVGSRIKAYANRASAPIPEDFDRNVRAFGSEGQNALRSATVGIVGLGGTGSIVAEYLAHLGVGRLILLDPDKIERTNLNRVVGASIEDIGSYKVQVAAKHINRIRNDIDVVPIQGSVNHAWEARALLAGDLIVCCTDS